MIVTAWSDIWPVKSGECSKARHQVLLTSTRVTFLLPVSDPSARLFAWPYWVWMLVRMAGL